MTERAVPLAPHATLGGAILLAAWLGAAIFFAAVVARAAFQALPTRALAGALVGATLPALFLSGAAVGVAAALAAWRPSVATARGARLAGAFALAVSCALGQFAIGPRIDRLRSSLGTSLETLAPTDPSRIAFGRLHALSVLALAVAMIGALVGLAGAYLALRASHPPPP